MTEDGKRMSFTLDHGEMNALFAILEEAFKDRKNEERAKTLRWLRDRLYSYVS
jgi:hypothetical protein